MAHQWVRILVQNPHFALLGLCAWPVAICTDLGVLLRFRWKIRRSFDFRHDPHPCLRKGRVWPHRHHIHAVGVLRVRVVHPKVVPHRESAVMRSTRRETVSAWFKCLLLGLVVKSTIHL